MEVDGAEAGSKIVLVEISATTYTCQIIQPGTIIPSIYLPHIHHALLLPCPLHCVIGESSTAVLAVTGKQILYFNNGKLISLLSKPDTMSNIITHVQYWQPNEQTLLCGILDAEKTFYILDIYNMRLIQQYTQVSGVYVGDFLCRGGEQVLLQHCPADRPQSTQTLASDLSKKLEVTLTDGLQCWITPDNNNQYTEDTPHHSLQVAEKALTQRAHSGVQAVERCKQQRDSLLHLIQESFEAVAAMALNSDLPQPQNTGLVCLTGENIDQNSNSIVNNDNPLQVLDIWHKIINESWVVGVNIRNSRTDVVYDAGLVLTPCNASSANTSMSCKSKLVSCNFDSSDKFSSKLARVDRSVVAVSSLGEGQCATVLAVTDLPSLHTAPSFSVNAVLHWRRQHTTNQASTGDVSGQDDKYCMLVAGSVCLSVQDLLSDSLSVRTSMSDSGRGLLALSAYHMSTSLYAKCVFSSLTDLHHLLERALCFCRWPQSQYWVCNKRGPLYLSMLSIDIVTPVHVNMTCYTRDESQLFTLLHSLYACLPDDVIILPRDQTHQSQPSKPGNHQTDSASQLAELLSKVKAEIDGCRQDLEEFIINQHENTQPETIHCSSGSPQSEFEVRQQKLKEVRDYVLSAELRAKYRHSQQARERATENVLQAIN